MYMRASTVKRADIMDWVHLRGGPGYNTLASLKMAW